MLNQSSMSAVWLRYFAGGKYSGQTIKYNAPSILFSLWFCAGLLWILPNHGGSGLVLPQNLLAWSVLALVALWSVTTEKKINVVFPAGTSCIITGALLWSLPILWSPVSAWQWNALPKVLALWGLLSVWLLLLKSTSSLRLRHPLLIMLTVAVLLQVLYGVVQLSDIENLPSGRPYGSFQQTNVFASFLATGMLCALWWFTLSRHRLARTVCAIALMLIPVMLVLVQSRTGYLGAITGGALLLLVSRKKRRAGLAFLLLIAGAMTGLCLLRYGPEFFPGLIPEQVQKDGSTVQRWYMLHLTWKLILQHPIVGNGYGSFEYLFGQLTQQIPPGLESSTIQYPHNEFLYTWMEGGIVAVMGVLLMVFGILKRLWGKGGRRWGGLALLLPVALHMNLEYPLYQSVTHGITLILLLFITGPVAKANGKTASTSTIRRAGIVVLASAVLVFMLSGVVTEVQLTKIEQQGLMPLVRNENLSLLNPWSQRDRLDFDRHVALLLKFNLTQNTDLLTQYQMWAEDYLLVHNNPDVYHSLMMIYRASRLLSAQRLCLQAKAMWPEDLRFGCVN